MDKILKIVIALIFLSLLAFAIRTVYFKVSDISVDEIIDNATNQAEKVVEDALKKADEAVEKALNSAESTVEQSLQQADDVVKESLENAKKEIYK